MRNVLLVGGSYSAIPIINELVKKNLRITVLSGDREEPCHKIADSSILADYKETKSCLKMLKDIDIDYVVPSSNDTAYEMALEISAERGLPGFDNIETYKALCTKTGFRKFTEKYGMPAPKRYSLESFTDLTSEFDLIVKPNLGFSGIGVSRVSNSEDLKVASRIARSFSEDHEIQIEEFVEGSLHSASCFMVNHEVVKSFFVDEFCTVYPYQVDNSNHPSILSSEIKKKTIDVISDISTKLDLVDGLFHVQFINHGGEPRLIEVMRRAPGDLYGRMIELSTKDNYYENYINPFIARRISFKELSNNHEIPISRFTESSNTPRVFSSFRLEENAKEFYPLVSPGQRIGSAPIGKTSILFRQFGNLNEMLKCAPNFGSILTVNENPLT
jgi:biotin carboxylase